MSKQTFTWNKVKWEGFQDMCIYIGNKVFFDKDFDHYLKGGQKQDGIDLYDRKATKNITCVQCKKVEKITNTELRDFIKEFTDNPFSKKAKKFILATTADLQNIATRTKLESYKTELKNNYKIEFEWWDIAFIETRLKQHAEIVKQFFGDYEAETYCLQVVRDDRLEIQPLDNYIPRVIKKFKPNNSTNKEWSWTWFEKEETFDLTDLIVENGKLNLKKICLVGDPYQGKSFYLHHCAYTLQNQNFKPLFLRVKENSVQPIVDLLDTNFGNWRSIPYSNIVVFIDGLDEVAATSFDEFGGYINDFVTKYTNITLVFSCRKFFYEEYKLEERVKDITTYELHSLNYISIEKYIQDSLPTDYELFWKEIRRKNLESILYYPFYLTYLVKRFNEVDQQLPQTKSDTLKEFIEEEFSKATSKRRLPNGRTLDGEKALYYHAIEKFAFSLQLSGLNAYPYVDVKQLFKKEEIELLEQSTLITTHNKQWSFVNALFQEHLAAVKLSSLPTKQILECISIGKEVKKVKTKWVQSYSMLLSIMDDSETRKELIDFLKKDNPELIFTIEPTKYRSEQRQEFLEELLCRCIKLHIRLLSIHENNIAVFIEDIEESIDYLTNLLGVPEIPIIVKIICARVLVLLQLNSVQANKIYQSVKQQIPLCEDAYYAQHLLEILAKEKLGSKADIDYWIKLPLNEKHEFRDGMYKLIMSLNMVDSYYCYGLEGIEKLFLYNKGVHHSSSEHQLQEFLLSTNKREHLKSLLKLELSPKWKEFTDRQASDFFTDLIKRLDEVIERSPYIIFEVVEFIENIEERNLRHEFENFSSITDSMLTGNLLLRCLFFNLQEKGKELTWDYGALITPSSFDFIFSEFEEGRISLKELQEIGFGYSQKSNSTALKDFHNLCMDVTEGQLYPPPDQSTLNSYEVEIKRRENGIACLQSIETFKSIIENTFDILGKKKVDVDEVYIDFDLKPDRRQVASDIIYRTLYRYKRGNNSVYLSDFDNLTTDQDFFDFFRAYEILNYNFTNSTGEESLKEILRQYYNTKIKIASFQNCEWDEENNSIGYNKLECLLVKIFKKFQFTTPNNILMNMVWVARGAIKRTEIKVDSINNRYSLIGLIVQHLSDEEIKIFKKKILDNLQIGIKSTQVLCNHIGLCGYYNIRGAKDVIWDIIETSRLDVYSTASCIDIYLKLEGSSLKVEKIFKQITDYNSSLFTHLIETLKDKNLELTKANVLLALNSHSTTAENKIYFARYLANLGVNDGFAYLANFVREHKRSPYSIQGRIDVHHVDTEFAVEQIRDLMYLVIDPKYEEGISFIDSTKSILLEWLEGFAAKSEKDLLLIENLLLDSRNSLSNTYTNAANHFNWYIIRYRENFRNSENNSRTIKEVKSILQSLED